MADVCKQEKIPWASDLRLSPPAEAPQGPGPVRCHLPASTRPRAILLWKCTISYNFYVLPKLSQVEYMGRILAALICPKGARHKRAEPTWVVRLSAMNATICAIIPLGLRELRRGTGSISRRCRGFAVEGLAKLVLILQRNICM